MSTQGIFPTQDDEHNVYYNRVIPYINVPDNMTRLIIDTVKSAARSADLLAWNTVFPQVKDKNLSTKTLRDQKNGLIVTIEDGLREIYDDIPESLLTEADRNTLNLKKRDANPTPRAAITITPFANAQGKAGALVEFICRTTTDSTRPSILPEADGAEVVYNVGGTQPVNPSDCNRNFFSTKAKFRIGFEPGDAGKKVHGFIRWKNTSDPSKSGPWKTISTMITE